MNRASQSQPWRFGTSRSACHNPALPRSPKHLGIPAIGIYEAIALGTVRTGAVAAAILAFAATQIARTEAARLEQP